MHEKDLIRIADDADMIVCGYAFTLRKDGFISILNLNNPDCAMVINRACELIETNMDPIEQQLVLQICQRNIQFMENQGA
jgi:hypothetical protein